MLRDLKAWWWRNVKYRGKLFNIGFSTDCRFKPFEILCAREGKLYIYVGKGKFIQSPSS